MGHRYLNTDDKNLNYNAYGFETWGMGNENQIETDENGINWKLGVPQNYNGKASEWTNWDEEVIRLKHFYNP